MWSLITGADLTLSTVTVDSFHDRRMMTGIVDGDS